MSKTNELERIRKNLRDEIDGAALYTALAAAEKDPVRRDLYLQLSEAEAEHADVWKEKLTAAGVRDIPSETSLRTRFLAWLARRFGPDFVLPTVAAQELVDRKKHSGQVDTVAFSGAEHGHSTVVLAAARSRSNGSISVDIANTEPWHRARHSNEFRTAVFGANDGLVSNFCLVMGIAGAGVGSQVILLTGLAGLIAGACSMALGEWLSITNARQLARTQIDKEKQKIVKTPEAEQKELALVFQAKGLNRADAQKAAADLMRNKQAAPDTPRLEELGIDPAELGDNPWSATVFSFMVFSVGALFPVLPFLFSSGVPAIELCVGLSALALGTIGVATSLFNGRPVWYSVARQILIGCVAAGLTFGMGVWLGVSLS